MIKLKLNFYLPANTTLFHVSDIYGSLQTFNSFNISGFTSSIAELIGLQVCI